MSPEKHDSTKEEEMSPWPEGERESPKEVWLGIKWKFYSKVQRTEKLASSWEEGWSSLPEGAESQRGMTQRMRKMTTRQTKEIEKESINIFLEATFNI